jgi:hypothetical protein
LFRKRTSLKDRPSPRQKNKFQSAESSRAMKVIAFIFLSIISLSPVQAGTLSLEAHETGTGDARISLWETNYGSYDRDFSRSKRILVTLRNISRKPAAFAVTVYFIAKPTVAPSAQGYDPRALFIYDRGEHAGEFHNELELSGAFSSRVLSANVQHYQALGVESASGSDMIGWIVVGWSNGQRFGVATSSQELLQTANTSALESMIAVYEQKHPSTLNAKNADELPPNPSAIKEAAVTAAPAPPPLQIPAAEFITLTRAVEVPIAYGKTKLSAGTRLRVVSRIGTSINAVYLGETVAIPRDAVSK